MIQNPPGDVCAYCETGVAVTVNGSCGSVPTSATISGITDGAYYLVTVTAANIKGVGAASPASASILVAAEAPGAVTSPTALGRPGGLNISWTPPSGGNSAITDYMVTVYNASSQAVVYEDDTGSTATATEVSGNGINDLTSYEVSVDAKDNAGWGPPGAMSGKVTPPGCYMPAAYCWGFDSAEYPSVELNSLGVSAKFGVTNNGNNPDIYGVYVTTNGDSQPVAGDDVQTLKAKNIALYAISDKSGGNESDINPNSYTQAYNDGVNDASTAVINAQSVGISMTQGSYGSGTRDVYAPTIFADLEENFNVSPGYIVGWINQLETEHVIPGFYLGLNAGDLSPNESGSPYQEYCDVLNDPSAYANDDGNGAVIYAATTEITASDDDGSAPFQEGASPAFNPGGPEPSPDQMTCGHSTAEQATSLWQYAENRTQSDTEGVDEDEAAALSSFLFYQ